MEAFTPPKTLLRSAVSNFPFTLPVCFTPRIYFRQGCEGSVRRGARGHGRERGEGRDLPTIGLS